MEQIFDHAASFADHLESNTQNIHKVLRRYQSNQVIVDEIQRSVDTLRNLSSIGRYFSQPTLSESTAVFIPLNLPLYSFILFGVMPAYQSSSLFMRVPERMKQVFRELKGKLFFKKYYPNIHFFSGPREQFVSNFCQPANVVIFTGRQENFLNIQKMCGKNKLVLYNGVGHNPVVVTPSADLDLAIKKVLHVKLFNNGQDCAGPDIVLVHSLIADEFTKKLVSELRKVVYDTSYVKDDVVIGPLFEPSSLTNFVQIISRMCNKGGKIAYGGQIDLSCNAIYPCVVRIKLRQMQNFTELYSPLFCVAEYTYDRELSLYFDDAKSRYQNNEMYISLFGESETVAEMKGSIILKNRTIHDVESGIYEYGGYSSGASQVSYRGIHISKPLLIPREIHNFLSPTGQTIFSHVQNHKGNHEQQIVATQFQEKVQEIFRNQLFFAYIFGSFAVRRDKRYSDIDTLICVRDRNMGQVEDYLGWLFNIHELFGRIPDFKYPTEIVTLEELESAVKLLPVLRLSAIQNNPATFDAMVWCHSLSQPWIGEINPENVPKDWKKLFPEHGCRLLRSFLSDLEKAILLGSFPQLKAEMYEIPRKEPEVSHFINNLKGRGLLHVLKMIPFDEQPIYSKMVLKLVNQREFIGKRLFKGDDTEHLYNPYFRFGVV